MRSWSAFSSIGRVAKERGVATTSGRVGDQASRAPPHSTLGPHDDAATARRAPRERRGSALRHTVRRTLRSGARSGLGAMREQVTRQPEQPRPPSSSTPTPPGEMRLGSTGSLRAVPSGAGARTKKEGRGRAGRRVGKGDDTGKRNRDVRVDGGLLAVTRGSGSTVGHGGSGSRRSRGRREAGSREGERRKGERERERARVSCSSSLLWRRWSSQCYEALSRGKSSKERVEVMEERERAATRTSRSKSSARACAGTHRAKQGGVTSTRIHAHSPASHPLLSATGDSRGGDSPAGRSNARERPSAPPKVTLRRRDWRRGGATSICCDVDWARVRRGRDESESRAGSWPATWPGRCRGPPLCLSQGRVRRVQSSSDLPRPSALSNAVPRSVQAAASRTFAIRARRPGESAAYSQPSYSSLRSLQSRRTRSASGLVPDSLVTADQA